MKNLLIIGYVWPEPNSSAAGSRMMQLIKFFQWQGYHVTFSSPAQRTEHMIDLAKQDISMVNIALNCSSFDDFISNNKKIVRSLYDGRTIWLAGK